MSGGISTVSLLRWLSTLPVFFLNTSFVEAAAVSLPDGGRGSQPCPLPDSITELHCMSSFCFTVN